jgi:hypothetical protein
MAPVLQAIEELARTSITSTELRDLDEGLKLNLRMVGFRKQEVGRLDQHACLQGSSKG